MADERARKSCAVWSWLVFAYRWGGLHLPADAASSDCDYELLISSVVNDRNYDD